VKSGTHSPRKVDLSHPAINALVSDENPPAKGSIAWKLWLNAADIANEALNSDFIQGIKHGDLSPDKYGHYTIQDAAYCQHGEEDYRTIESRAKEMNEPTLAAFAEARYLSYASYTKSVLESWHLKDITSLTPGPAAQAYIDFERQTAQTLDPIYLIIAMIPCDQLWPWLAGEISSGNRPGNVYDFWITENNSWHGAYRLDNFINAWFAEHPDQYNEPLANWVFQSCMTGEANFFRGACAQPLLPMPKKP